MQYQHRHGAPSRPRNNDHTVWANDRTDSLSAWYPVTALAVFGLLAACGTLAQ